MLMHSVDGAIYLLGESGGIGKLHLSKEWGVRCANLASGGRQSH